MDRHWTDLDPCLYFPADIEFNLTGCYGSPVHSNHNSNYSSMPSPDMDQSERKPQHDQSRRPLSVATDNMMLEFYKKDGYGANSPTANNLPLCFPRHRPLLVLSNCGQSTCYYG